MPDQSHFDEAALFIAGQRSRSYLGELDDTKVNAQVGRPRVDHIVFADTWAPADTQTTTIAGIAVVTTLQGGDNTPVLAAARALATLNANPNVGALASFSLTTTSTSNDTLVVTQREVTEGAGVYYDLPVASAESTAGDGTATASNEQTRLNQGSLPFGVGVAHDTTDPRGKRVTLPGSTGFLFGGIVLHRHDYANHHLLGNDGVPATRPFTARLKGYAAVRVDLDVLANFTPGQQAYLKYATDGNGPAGQWRHDDTNADAVMSATFTGRRVDSSTNPLAEILIA